MKLIGLIVFFVVIGGRVYGQEPVTAPVAEPTAVTTELTNLQAQVKALTAQLASLSAKVPAPTAADALEKKKGEYVDAVERTKAAWTPICKALKGVALIVADSVGKVTATCEVRP